jgi:hypothetical protein
VQQKNAKTLAGNELQFPEASWSEGVLKRNERHGDFKPPSLWIQHWLQDC